MVHGGGKAEGVRGLVTTHPHPLTIHVLVRLFNLTTTRVKRGKIIPWGLSKEIVVSRNILKALKRMLNTSFSFNLYSWIDRGEGGAQTAEIILYSCYFIL